LKNIILSVISKTGDKIKSNFEKMKILFIKVLVLIFLLNNSAYAYFDPGSGAFIVQSIIAMFGIMIFYLGYPIRILKNILKKIRLKLFKSKYDEVITPPNDKKN